MGRVKRGEIAWVRWFDMATWTAIEAAKLTICGKKECFSPNICKMSDFNCRVYTLDSARNLNKMIERAMQAGELSRHNTLSPYEYIRWALTKKSITLPQEMIDWYGIQSNNEVVSIESQLTGKNARIAELEAQLVGIRQRIVDLEAELAKKDEQIADWKFEAKQYRAELEAARQQIVELTTVQGAPDAVLGEAAKLPRTAAATEARATAELAKWKEEYSPAMVRVALRCGVEGGRKRQSSDFVSMFKAAGVTLSKNMLNMFRGWLPDEHTDRTGGAPTQD